MTNLLFVPSTWVTVLTAIALTIGTISTLVVWAAVRANKRAEDSFYRSDDKAEHATVQPQRKVEKVVKQS